MKNGWQKDGSKRTTNALHEAEDPGNNTEDSSSDGSALAALGPGWATVKKGTNCCKAFRACAYENCKDTDCKRHSDSSTASDTKDPQPPEKPTELEEWAHSVRHEGGSKKNNKSKITAFQLENPTDLDRAAKIMAAAAGNPTPGEKPEDDEHSRWSIADTGTAVTGADCAEVFPGHTTRPSKGQRKGHSYTCADGSKVINEGEVHIVHATDEGHKIDIIIQHVKTVVPLLSIRKFAHRGCAASFCKGGGEIRFASGVVMQISETCGVLCV